jgi:D-alanyl-lipoteichoic acid acyltransferase DltB (MBOAT superfamily)
MGFDLSRNFAYPYFSSNIQEFWRRWHMSLTGWFREYVYQPLGGSQTSTWRWIRNVMLVFLLSGLWHGADWKFVIWGLIHGTAYLGFILYSLAAGPPSGGTLRGLLGWAATMIVVVVGWIFFRAASMSDALTMVSILLTPSEWLIKPHHWFPYTLLLIAFFMAIEWTGRSYDHPLAFPFLGFWKREAIVIASIFALAVLGASSGSQFVYFQF